MSSPHAAGKIEPKFSAPLFLLTIFLTLAGLLGLLAWSAPEVWEAQFAASWVAFVGVFLGVHAAAAVVEFFFHRYVLHAPLVPFLSYFYRQHTLHHALTRVACPKPAKSGGPAARPGESIVLNVYPIIAEPQYEASYFPWYTFAAFAALATVVFIPLQWLLPAAPIFLAGFVSLAWSISLYELVHAVEHWPQATWDRLIAHPTRGRFWRKAYAFHLRHHADIRCNEAISGFFAFPAVDLILGTYVDPETLYTHGQPAHASQFASPRPRFAFVRWLDRKAEESVQRRRHRRAGGSTEKAAAETQVTAAQAGPKFAAAVAARARS